MKKYLYKKVVRYPLYRGSLVILLSNCEEKVSKIVPEYRKNGHIYAHTYERPYKDGYATYIILNPDYKHRKLTAGCVAHEALHATNFVLSDRGVVADFDNDEPIAYLIDWVVDEVTDFLIAKGKKTAQYV